MKHIRRCTARSVAMVILGVVLLATIAFFAYDMTASYTTEKYTDDISSGAFGLVFRGLLSMLILISEVDIACGIPSLLSHGSVRDTLLCATSCVLSTAILCLSAACYVGVISKTIQGLLVVAIVLYLLNKSIQKIRKTMRK